MRLRGANTVPSAVVEWLEQQLEERGIDSAVYGRYVLNFLRDESFDLSDLPHIDEGVTKKKTRFTSNNVEELKKNAVVDCLTLASDQAIEIEKLVDELCDKLKEAENEREDSCLKETTNFEEYFDLELPDETVNVSSATHSSSLSTPSKEKEPVSSSSWLPGRNFAARSCGRGWWCSPCSDVSPKVVKRKENKENVGVDGATALSRSRMRSRSVVKSSGGAGFGGGSGSGSCYRGARQMAKSLDRKDEETVARYVKTELKGRRTMSSVGEESDDQMSRTPGRKEHRVIDVLPSDLDRHLLPRQLLQSPADDASFYRQPRSPISAVPSQPNFLQFGMNISSSIWSEKKERMEEEDTQPLRWDNTKWSDASGSIFSSSWKQPCSYQEETSDSSVASKQVSSLASLPHFVNFPPETNMSTSSSASQTSVGGYREKKPFQVTQAEVTQETQEEDLLTSMKTHFRPIKDDEFSQQGYRDGFSFEITNKFETVKYRRSESGGFYLPDGTKYLEFKRSGSSDAFVPKFKVLHCEKFCQTDDAPWSDDGLWESQDGVDCDDDDEEDEDDWLSDEKFWDSSDLLDDENNNSNGNNNGEDVEEDVDNSPATAVPAATILLRGWVTSWPVASTSIWDHNMPSSWLPRGRREDSGASGGRNEDYSRLRSEVMEEGDELLSYLRSIHLFVDTDHPEEAKPRAPVSESSVPSTYTDTAMGGL